MSWSIALQNGDFPLSGSRLATVINEEKIAQDLRCAVLEPMGTDDMHPEYGSLIDGGTTPEGVSVPGVIGNDDVRQGAAVLNAEIERIVRDYQSQQLARAKNDRITYGRATLTPGEVLASVQDVEIVQNQDSLTATVAISSATGQTINLALSTS